MEPKIVRMDQFMVVGLRYYGKNEHQEITELWGRFNEHAAEIRHVATQPNAAFGLCFTMEPDGSFEYVAGLPVTELSDIPRGMVGKVVPAQTYAVMPAKGVQDIRAAYQSIHDWLPASGYQAVPAPDFEYYGEAFDPSNLSSTLYIYFPVQKA